MVSLIGLRWSKPNCPSDVVQIYLNEGLGLVLQLVTWVTGDRIQFLWNGLFPGLQSQPGWTGRAAGWSPSWMFISVSASPQASLTKGTLTWTSSLLHRTHPEGRDSPLATGLLGGPDLLSKRMGHSEHAGCPIFTFVHISVLGRGVLTYSGHRWAHTRTMVQKPHTN